MPNCKLSSLAGFFRAATTPNHRALQDARATVDVLHGLLDRLGNLGVQSLPELRSFCALVPPAVRRKRYLADAMPSGPGRVRLPRRRGAPALRRHQPQPSLAGAPVLRRERAAQPHGRDGRASPSGSTRSPAPTLSRRQVRELRLIAAHKPRYNRRSKFPERSVWLKLTDEVFPRLSIVRAPPGDGVAHLGPLRYAAAGRGGPRRDPRRRAVAPVHAIASRYAGWCGARARSPASAAARRRARAARPRRTTAHWSSLVVSGLDGRRPAARRPDARQAREAVRPSSASNRRAWSATASRPWCGRARACSTSARCTCIDELVAARPDGAGGWELSVVRRGRLAAAGVAARGVPPVRGRRRSARDRRRRRGRAAGAWPKRPRSSCAGSRNPAPGWCARVRRGRCPHTVPAVWSHGWRPTVPRRAATPFERPPLAADAVAAGTGHCVST